jgi:hypothetical protein
MADLTERDEDTRQAARRFALHFTPAEWRSFLEDASFLDAADNSYCPPRRLMGLPVEIVPDHRFG